MTRKIVNETNNIRAISLDLSDGTRGTLVIAATQTQARYFLPDIIVLRGHKLAKSRKLTLRQLAAFPLISYESTFTAGGQVISAFEKQGLQPDQRVIGIGADVIKICVEQGLGIAVLSELTYDKERDVKLQALPAGHLFEPSTTKIVVSRHAFPRNHTYGFVEMCAPHWSRSPVQRAISTGLTDTAERPSRPGR